jgi:hypothetical protein
MFLEKIQLLHSFKIVVIMIVLLLRELFQT